MKNPLQTILQELKDSSNFRTLFAQKHQDLEIQKNGKWLFNLRVIPADGPEDGKLRFVDVAYRETIGKFLSGVILNAGYILAGPDREKRALHDMLCDTRVIYSKRVKAVSVQPAPHEGRTAVRDEDTVERD